MAANMSHVHVATRDDVPIFDETNVDYAEWRDSFYLFIEGIGGTGILDGTDVVEVPDPNNPDPDVSARYDLHRIMFRSLMNTTTGTPNKIVRNSKTVALSNGCCRTAWTNLKNEYAPSHTAAMYSKIAEFDECRLKEGESPRDWFLRIETLRSELQDLGTNTSGEIILSKNILK